jgi:hypothetical protein
VYRTGSRNIVCNVWSDAAREASAEARRANAKHTDQPDQPDGQAHSVAEQRRPTDNDVQKIREVRQKLMNERGYDPNEVATASNAAANRLVSGASVWVRVPPEVIPQIVKDGRVKSQFGTPRLS